MPEYDGPGSGTTSDFPRQLLLQGEQDGAVHSSLKGGSALSGLENRMRHVADVAIRTRGAKDGNRRREKDRCPDMTKMETTDEVSYETIEPNAAALTESHRDIGYTPSTAIADIVDNSLTADASEVSIRVNADPDDAAVAIIDDGHGMSSGELFEAMRPGSRNPTERRSEKGPRRFRSVADLLL